MDSLSPFLQDSFIPYFMPVYPGAPQLSTGPRTAEGKDRVRLNATKHGLYSKEIVLPAEDQAAYERLGELLLATWSPATDESARLVQLLLDTQWRLNRIVTLDFNMLTLGTAEQLDSIDTGYDQTIRECLAQAAAYRANARTFDQLYKHETRLRRLYDQTRSELLLLQGAPLRHAPVAAQAQPAPQPEVGFVPNAAESVLQPAAAKLPKMPKFAGPLKNVNRKQWLRKHGIAA